MTKIDPRICEYATPRQRECIEATNLHGSQQKAAKALGIAFNAVNGAIKGAVKKAAAMGYSPEHDLTHPVAPGQMLSGVTSLYKDGKLVHQYVKSKADSEALETYIRETGAAMAAALPRQKPMAAPNITDAKLANLYTFTDSHVGALCWDRENLDPNGNWDVEIAERTLTGCFEYMVKASPAAKLGIVAQLGDWMHIDGLAALTPTSGHLLDADSRFPKMVNAAVRILRRIVNMALAKHEFVLLLIAEGNHDPASSVWLRTLFAALYENEPRVKVIDSVLPYYVYEHGSTMLGWHHGHLQKNDQLPILFAAQFPKVWGATTKRYIHCGHRHHVEEKEHSGVTVVQHATLAARDAYASRGGWLSERQCTSITYHMDYGQVARNTVCPEMLLDAGVSLAK